MRTEKDMMALLLGTAGDDERIRAVYMNGSRTNPRAPADAYRDYDIVYVVTDTRPFIEDEHWIDRFGRPLMVQRPEWNDFHIGLNAEKPDFGRCYGWLMLFDDGNRIDLHVCSAEAGLEDYLSDKLTIRLLDKDGILPDIPPPSDEDYHVKPPIDCEFTAACNEFWWCLNNVAKGIARDELPYAMQMLNRYVRDMLDRMAEWHIGIRTDFAVSAGKMGKYFKRYLPEALYRQYTATYCSGEAEAMWTSVFVMCDLFHILALAVAAHFGFAYRQDEEDGIREYLHRVQNGTYAAVFQA